MGGAQRLERALRPRSIAVIGGRFAQLVVRQCQKLGYEGEVWPVNPKRAEMAGLPCYPDLASLPRAPDIAYVAVERATTVKLVGELSAMGAGGAISYASGFAETDQEGAALQAQLVEAAGAMPVLGPNCYGVLNYLDGAGLWLDHHGGARVAEGVGLIAQSSNVAINLTCLERPLPIAFVLALGNAAMVDLAEAIEALAADPKVTAIGLHVEGIGDPARVQDALLAARRAGKPVIALELGVSQAAAERAKTHSAALTGSAKTARAFFERCGAAVVRSLDSFAETLRLLHVLGPAENDAIATASCSGGEAALAADAIDRRRLRAPAFSSDEAAAIRRTVNPLVEVSNPFDYHTFDWTDPPRLEATFEAYMKAAVDTAVLILDPPRSGVASEEWLEVGRAFARAARRFRPTRRAALLSTHSTAWSAEATAEFERAGLAVLAGFEPGFDALEAAAAIGRDLPCAEPARFSRFEPGARGELLDEVASKALLRAAGIAIPEGGVVSTVEDAVALAARLGGPVVLKLVKRDVAHKNEVGGLALDLEDPAVIAREAERILALGGDLLVERFTKGGAVELLVGAARDPAIGLHVLVGAGGVLTEALDDVAILLPPVTEAEIGAALDRLRIGPRLARKGDRAAAIAQIAKIIQFVTVEAETVATLDVNPLLVGAAGAGAVAVDALIERRAPVEARTASSG